MLGTETLKSVKCAYPCCNLSYDEHISDKVIMLQLKNNIEKEEMQKIAERIISTLPEKSFDGFVFIDTKEKFRIL